MGLIFDAWKAVFGSSGIAFEIVVALFLLVCMAVFACLLDGEANRRSSFETFGGIDSNDDDDDDEDVEVGVGESLQCSQMDASLRRSSPSCGLNLPNIETGKLCIDGTCIRPCLVRN
jgi:hypothetical protein